jgi:hypothetical protein
MAQATLLKAYKFKKACPDGMFLTTDEHCQGKKFSLLQFCSH